MRQKYFYIGIFLSTLAIAAVSIAALLYSPYLGIEYKYQNEKWVITSINKDSPSYPQRESMIGREVISIAGRDITQPDLLKEFDDLSDKGKFDSFIMTQKYLSTHIEKGIPVSITLKDSKNHIQTISVTPSDYPIMQVIYKAGIILLTGLVSIFIGLIVILQKITDIKAVVFFFLTFCLSIIDLTLGIFVAREIGFNIQAFYLMFIIGTPAMFYAGATLLHFCVIFPEETAIARNRYLIYTIYILAFIGTILYGFRLYYYIYPIVTLLFILGGLVAILYNYLTLRSPTTRSQVKIILFGTGLAMIIFPALYFGPMLLGGHKIFSAYLPMITTILLPLSMAFAIMRYKLMDIDTLFDNTIVYMLTLGILAIIDVTMISALVNTKILSFYISAPVATILSTWLVMLIYIPIRDRIQRWLKYILNREIYDTHGVSLELNRELLSAKDIESAFEKTMDVIKKTLRPKGGYALLLNEKGSVIMWNDAYPIDLPIDIGSIKDSPHPISLYNTGDTTPLPQNYSGGILVPIVGKIGHLGYLILQNKESGRLYDKDDFKLLNMIATQIAMAMEAISSRDKMVQREKEAIAEKERISREIHDGIGNDLAQALILSNAAKSNTKYIPDIQKILTESLTNLRELIWTVEPGSGTLSDMATYISDKIQYLQNTGTMELSTSISIENEQFEVSSIIKLNILRIIQESITNTIKHAEATSMHIILTQHEDKLKLEIRDNGKGFDMAKISDGGYGLRNIQKRCKEMGAKLNILTDPGEGTQISIDLSL